MLQEPHELEPQGCCRNHGNWNLRRNCRNHRKQHSRNLRWSRNCHHRNLRRSSNCRHRNRRGEARVCTLEEVIIFFWNLGTCGIASHTDQAPLKARRVLEKGCAAGAGNGARVVAASSGVNTAGLKIEISGGGRSRLRQSPGILPACVPVAVVSAGSLWCSPGVSGGEAGGSSVV